MALYKFRIIIIIIIIINPYPIPNSNPIPNHIFEVVTVKRTFTFTTALTTGMPLTAVKLHGK